MEDVFDVNPKIVFENHIFTMKIFFLGVNELNKKNMSVEANFLTLRNQNIMVAIL